MASETVTYTNFKITLDKNSAKEISVAPQSVTPVEDSSDLKIDLSPAPDDAFKQGDNFVTVTYTSDTGTVVTRKAKLTLDDTRNNAVLSPSKSSVTLNFRGQMAIGPDPLNPAVELAVRFGNMNKNKDWIIDFSDKVGDEKIPGTKINVGALVNWLNTKNEEVAANETAQVGTGSTVEKLELQKPELLTDGQFKDIMDYNIVFKEFHFNITQKTFKMRVKVVKN